MTAYRYYLASTVDGFIADPDDGIEWLMTFGTDEFGDSYSRLMAATGALVMGSRTYDFLLAQDDPWPYGDLPAWVFTTRDLPPIDGAAVRFVAGEVTDHLGDIAASAGDKDVWIVGGGPLAGAFEAAGALDEIVVTFMPVLLGAGKPLFAAQARPRSLEFVSSETFPSGAVELVYRVQR